MTTKIEWCDETINPIQDVRKGKSGRGYYCTKCSPGCDHCYAERINKLRGNGLPFILPHPSLGIDPLVTFELIESELQKLCAWKKSRSIFVQSMGDLFHESVPDEFIDRVFNEMGFHGIHHTFLTLSKRPQRMLDYYKRLQTVATHPLNPFPNVWPGLTVCNQPEADAKIPVFLQVPGKKVLSIEPMLGVVDFDVIWAGDYYCPQCRNHFDVPARYVSPCCGAETNGDDEFICQECKNEFPEDEEIPECPHCGNIGGTCFIQPDHRDCHNRNREGAILEKFDAVILGGETGPGARPMHPDWVRSVRDQCAVAGVDFFFKGWGEYVGGDVMESFNGHPGWCSYQNGTMSPNWSHEWSPQRVSLKVKRAESGRLLDGRTHDDLPWRVAP